MLHIIGVPMVKGLATNCCRTRLFQLLWAILIVTGWVESAWIQNAEDEDNGISHRHSFDVGTAVHGRSADEAYSRNQLVGPALNVTALAGETALLACLAPHLGDKTISWIRQRDLAILVSGQHVYTSDPRISFAHPQYSDLWGLQDDEDTRCTRDLTIRRRCNLGSLSAIIHSVRNMRISPVRSSDEGSYQCQINTEPKMSRSVALIVLDQDLKDSPNLPPPPPSLMTDDETVDSTSSLSLKILGPSERWVRQGSDVTIFCSAALQHPSPTITGKNMELSWWQGGLKLNEKYSQGHYGITQDFGLTAAAIQLQLYAVRPSDSGVYSCKVEPKVLRSYSGRSAVVTEASVIVHVTEPSSASSVFPLASNYYFTWIFSFFTTARAFIL